MKKLAGVVVAIASVGVLAGCTTAPVRSAAAPIDNYDYQKMAQTESAARTNGARIVWVHPPQARDGS